MDSTLIRSVRVGTPKLLDHVLIRVVLSVLMLSYVGR